MPCPGCHPRQSGLLPDAVAFEPAVRSNARYLADNARQAVSYIAPRRSAYAADAAHRWACARCTRSFEEGEVLPSWSGSGGLSGRAWERKLEQSVLGLEQLCSETPPAQLARGSHVHTQMVGLSHMVARSVGARHWTSGRIRAMLQRAESDASSGACLRHA